MGRRIASLVFLGALSACSTAMETRPVSLQQNRIDGVPYALPVLVLETKVTHRLKACSVVLPGQPGYQAVGSSSEANLVVEFETTVENEAQYPAGEYFVLDYQALAAATKTSSFKVTFHDNRMLSAINVAAEDQTIDIAVETIRAGVSIASLVTGVPLPAGANNQIADVPVACPTGRKAAATRGPNGEILFEDVPLIDLRKSVADLRKEAVEALADATSSVAALNARASGTLSPADQVQITTLTNDAKAIADRIKGYDRQLAEFDQTLAYTETVRWQPPAGLPTSQIVTQRFPFHADDQADNARGAARMAWMVRLFNQKDKPGFAVFFGPLDSTTCDTPACDGRPGRRIARTLTIDVRLQPAHEVANPASARAAAGRLGISTVEYDPANETASLVSGTPRDHIRGVVARQPLMADFIVCSDMTVPCTDSSPRKVHDSRVSVPQLGPYVVLPFSNGPGENNALNATFAQTGEPTMVEYRESSAAGLEIASGLSSAASSLNGFFTSAAAQREAEEDEALARPLEDLQRQYALMQQQQAIATLQEQVSPTNPLTLLQREVSLMELEVRAAQLQALQNPESITYQERYEELTKNLALLKLEVQIAEQQRLLAGS